MNQPLCTSPVEILHSRTTFDIASLSESKTSPWPPLGIGVRRVSRTPTIYEVSRGVPTILLPGSNTFFFARIPDTRYIFHRLSLRSMQFSWRGGGRSTDPRGVRTNQSFATADPHKFFHADSPATEHATESWITMSGITFRLLLLLFLFLDLTGFTSATSARLASTTIDFHPRSTPFNIVADKEVARHPRRSCFIFKIWNLIYIRQRSFVSVI